MIFKFDPMPILYNGFGPTAILVMLLCLITRQLYIYWKQRHQKL
jgi:hypothetical protein